MAAHTTLEMQAPPNSATDYLGYWQQGRQAAGNLSNVDLTRFNHLSSLLGTLAYHGLRDPDPDKIKHYADVLYDRPEEPIAVIAAWDRANGSFNHMVEGQGDLLRAAGWLLFHNRRDQDPDSFKYPLGEPRDTLEAFSSIFAQNGLEGQNSSQGLLLMGQLLSKAAWIDRDKERQTRLFSMAEKTYSQLYNTPDKIDPMLRLKAGEYIADLHFHNLSRQLRNAKRTNDKLGLRRVRRTAGELLSAQLVDLKKLGDTAHRAENQNLRNELMGLMVEHLSMIQIRHDIFMSGVADIGENVEVRRAFTSEDEPLEIQGRRKTSFDIVVQTFDKHDRVVATHPIQIKSRRHGYTEQDRRKQSYITEVEVATMEGLTPGMIMHAASGLLKHYRQETGVISEPALDIVDKSLRPILVSA